MFFDLLQNKKGRHMLAFFALALSCSASIALAGDEIYTWRDKDGGLHFSSTPPSPEDTVDENGVEALNIDPQGKQGVGIKKRDGGWYCGKRLMRLEAGSGATLQSGQAMLNTLLSEKKRAAGAYEKFLATEAAARLAQVQNPDEDLTETVDPVRRAALKAHLDEVNCELRWVRRQLANLRRSDLKRKVEDKAISDRIRKLEKQKRSYCKANIAQMNAEQRVLYRSCIENFEKEIESLRKQISG